MLTLKTAVCIDAPHEVVWARLANLEEIQLWSAAVVRARCDGPITQGVGAERTCDLVSNQTIHERWIAWDEGRSFTYEGVGIPLMKRATNRWSVIPHGDTQALLVSEATLELKGGLLGRIIAPLVAPLLRRMAPGSLASFKYLVEQGQPYVGPANTLPAVPATCA